MGRRTSGRRSATTVRRGKADTLAGECSNGSMWSHMRNKQKTELEGARKDMETRKEAMKQEVNLKDETVRGSLPGFQANNCL